MSEDPNAEICFQDEVHFTVEATVTRQWFPKGSRPKVKSYPGRSSVAYSGFLSPAKGTLFVTKPDWFNYETTIKSIREFLFACNIDENRRIVLVLDNAPWHKKAARMIAENDEYSDIRDKVSILFLPPYSPDLNPIEQVWRITRKEKTHNRFWSCIKVLETTLDAWFDLFSKPNDKFVALCNFYS